MRRCVLALGVAAAMLPALAADEASTHGRPRDAKAASAHPHQGAAPAAIAEPAPAEARVTVDFPHDIKMRMLQAMRGHLENIHLIQQALAEGNHDRAAEVAEDKDGPQFPRRAQRAPGALHARADAQPGLADALGEQPLRGGRA